MLKNQSEQNIYLINIEDDKNKKRKNKIIVLIVLIILILILLIFIIYFSVNIINNSKIYKQYEEQVELLEQQELEKQEQEKQAKIPKLTDEGKENVKNIYHSETKRAFLTFDDGPSSVTNTILDVLKQENVKATFFVLGSRVEAKPDVVKRIYDEGHYIANHGYSHVYENIYASPQAVLDEYNTGSRDCHSDSSDCTFHIFRS